MEKGAITTSTNDQTHDFMNVDSFSQLPFLRPSPTTTKDNKSPSSSTSSSSAIRLFGIDFSSTTTTTATEISNSDNDTTTTNKDDNNKTNSENGESGRKFECHYCCRNFPTSQALGGHQNAHKRERQHAKRAHLQSAMMAADPHHNHHHHLYNHLVNYRPTNSYNQNYPSTLTNTTSRFSSNSTHFLPTSTTTPSNFGNHTRHHHHTPPTINGNPLMWRVPTLPHSDHSRVIHRDRSLPSLTYFNGTPNINNTSKLLNIDNSSKNSMSMSMSMSMNMSSSQTQIGRRGGSDHVSLDLRL
ncbi:hypothetical protein RND81_05G158300 [Saponaria officinalis]|uniref:C2H2-type domain-containing protein n=1 Tax=Saponaria officinalis TaxID=3572 RepID=A0AAW1KYH3_SAPOF